MQYDINSISMILFILHLAASLFMLSVIKKQLGLFKKYIDPELRSFRLILFLLSTTIFVGNFVPLIIDFLNAINDAPEDVPFGRILYISANAIIAVVSSGLIWSMYRQAAKTAVLVEEEKAEILKSRQ